MKTGTPQLKALYSMEIVNQDIEPTAGTPTDDARIIEYYTSRFNPVELYGYYKSGRILMFNSNIIDIDVSNCNDDIFVARYFEKSFYNIYVITVDSQKKITKKLDYQLFSTIEIVDNNYNKDGTIYPKYSMPDESFYSPEEIIKFARQGKTIKYTGMVLNTDFSLSNDEEYHAYFFNDKNIPYSITIDSERAITLKDESAAIEFNSLVEIIDPNDKSKSLYTPLEMINLSKNKIFTYNGNIINTDLTLSNENLYIGFYMDGFTMSVFRIKVDANKNLEYSTYKKIIRQIEIFNDASGIYNDFTIDGAIDNLDYYIKDVKNLYFVWDTARHFETWVTIDAEHYDCNLHFPSNTQWIRDEDLEPEGIERGRKRELSIKDGIIVSAPVGEEWIDFD